MFVPYLLARPNGSNRTLALETFQVDDRGLTRRSNSVICEIGGETMWEGMRSGTEYAKAASVINSVAFYFRRNSVMGQPRPCSGSEGSARRRGWVGTGARLARKTLQQSVCILANAYVQFREQETGVLDVLGLDHACRVVLT